MLKSKASTRINVHIVIANLLPKNKNLRAHIENHHGFHFSPPVDPSQIEDYLCLTRMSGKASKLQVILSLFLSKDHVMRIEEEILEIRQKL